MAFLQPGDIMNRCVGSGFDAAVIAVNGFMSGDLGIAEAIRLLLRGEQLDRSVPWLPLRARM